MKTLTLILSLFFCVFLLGQTNPYPDPNSYSKKELPNKLKKVFCYEDEQLVQIKEYNNNKKIIFTYDAQSWMKPMDLVYISGNLYNEKNQLIKSYWLHSNVGFFIKNYKYDESGNLVEIFEKNNKEESHNFQKNSNPFARIKDIKSLESMINDSSIIALDSDQKSFLTSEMWYDSLNNLISNVSYNDKGEENSSVTYLYDDKNNIVYMNNDWKAIGAQYEIYYNYESPFIPFHLTKQNQKKYDSLINKQLKVIQSVRLSYNPSNNRKVPSEITMYKYNDRDNLVESNYYQGGNFKYKYIYEYNPSGDLIRTLFFGEGAGTENNLIVEINLPQVIVDSCK